MTLHVGQLKTATTSLQAALFAARDTLAVQGIAYNPAAGRYHLRETLDLIRRDPESAERLTDRLQHTTRVILAEHDDYWPDFVSAARRHRGRTLLSSESMSFAGDATVRRVATDLDGVPLRIVATTRPLSAMVSSAYGELAKRYIMPIPDAFVRGVLRSLLDEGDESVYGWMLASRLRRLWAPIATDGWFEVPYGKSSATGYQEAFWRAMGIDRARPAEMPVQNTSLPVGAVVAWQDHLRRINRYDARVDGGTMTALMALNTTRPAAPRSRLRLVPDTAELVDACFPSGPDGLASDHDVAALRARLRTGAPLVEIRAADPSVGWDDEIAFWQAALRRRRRIVSTRIAVARLLRVRRSEHPDWDRFREAMPTASITFPEAFDG